jgi:tetratricopeptide (TPR) repeat protein
VVNYFNAMLWNSKTKQAEEFLQQQDSLLKPAQQLVLKARLYTTRGDYSNGLKYYDSLVKSYPDKYYVSEYAEVLLGKKEMQQSMLAMESAKQLFSENEYKAYQQKLKSSRMQNAGTEFVYFKDVAKNVRIENSIWWQQREGGKFRLRLSAGVSNVTSINDEKTKSQFAHVSVTERWNKAWSGQTDIHLQLIQPANEKGFSGITGKQTLQYQPNDRRMFGVYYGSEILNYTASILGENIRSNDAGYVTHIMLSGKSGIYSQGSAGVLSDNNKRYMFFGSLYHLFRTEPTIKGGANFSVLHFSDNTVKTYFSPDRYMNTEVFVDYISALPMLSRFYVQMQAAAGMQKIEKQNWEPAFRLQTELGLRLNHFETALKYQTSNVASNTGTGYKFNWYVLRLMWKW